MAEDATVTEATETVEQTVEEAPIYESVDDIPDDQLEAEWDRMYQKAHEESDDDFTQTPNPQETLDKETDTVEEEDESGKTEKTEDTSDKTPPEVPDYKSLYEQLKPKYDSFDGIIRKRQEELETLKAERAEVDQFKQMLSDPQIADLFYKRATGIQQPPQAQNPQSPNYDYTDPASVDAFIASRFQQFQQQQAAQHQQEQQRLAQIRYAALINANKATTAARAGVEIGVVEKALQGIQESIINGTVPEVALKIANFDKAIQDAEARGAEKERKKFENASKTTKRVTNASNAKSSESQGAKPKWKEMSPQDLERYSAGVTDPAEMEQIWEHIVSMGRGR